MRGYNPYEWCFAVLLSLKLSGVIEIETLAVVVLCVLCIAVSFIEARK